MALLTVASVRNAVSSSGPDIVLQSGHGANISALAFSPDGKFLLTASEDNTLREWDPRSGAELHVLRGHSNIVTALAISADGTRIASASLDHTLRVWNAASGEQLTSFRDPTPAAVNLLKFTPDAGMLVTAETVAMGTIVRLWSIREGRQKAVIQRGTRRSRPRAAEWPKGDASGNEAIEVRRVARDIHGDGRRIGIARRKIIDENAARMRAAHDDGMRDEAMLRQRSEGRIAIVLGPRGYEDELRAV